MDKRHRDPGVHARTPGRVFDKDMASTTTRSGREVRMTLPHRLFAPRRRHRARVSSRRTSSASSTPALFLIGDGFNPSAPVEFERIPLFATPSIFRHVAPARNR